MFGRQDSTSTDTTTSSDQSSTATTVDQNPVATASATTSSPSADYPTGSYSSSSFSSGGQTAEAAAPTDTTSATDSNMSSLSSAPATAPDLPSSTNDAEVAATETPTIIAHGSAMAQNPEESSDTQSADSSNPAPSINSGEDLLGIKQQALQQLTPLVGHLDQTPEEKFQTTMMMIQGSDDSSLIKDAYDAAQQISDEKAKAQALLDIVNEINYFTHHTAEQ